MEVQILDRVVNQIQDGEVKVPFQVPKQIVPEDRIQGYLDVTMVESIVAREQEAAAVVVVEAEAEVAVEVGEVLEVVASTAMVVPTVALLILAV